MRCFGEDSLVESQFSVVRSQSPVGLVERSVTQHQLYLAVPLDTYKTFFQLEFTKTAIKQYQVLLIVYNPVDEVIVQWIN